MKKIKEILNNLYQDGNAMTMFDATIANFSVNQAITLIKARIREVMIEKKDCHIIWAKERFKCDVCSMGKRCNQRIKNQAISDMDKAVEEV